MVETTVVSFLNFHLNHLIADIEWKLICHTYKFFVNIKNVGNFGNKITCGHFTVHMNHFVIFGGVGPDVPHP